MTNYLELLSKERDTIHRVQNCIRDAHTMNVTVLLELIDKLSPENTTAKEFRTRSVITYVTNWWHFIGQWEWPLSAVSKKAASSIADKLIQEEYPDGGERLDLYDDGIIFEAPDMAKLNGKDIVYFAEIAMKRGKNSLWPSIYVCDSFANATNILKELGVSKEQVRVAYGYTTDPNLIEAMVQCGAIQVVDEEPEIYADIPDAVDPPANANSGDLVDKANDGDNPADKEQIDGDTVAIEKAVAAAVAAGGEGSKSEEE